MILSSHVRKVRSFPTFHPWHTHASPPTWVPFTLSPNLIQLSRRPSVPENHLSTQQPLFLKRYFGFWLHWVSVAFERVFSSCGEWGLFCCGAQAPRGGGPSYGRARALGAQASPVAAHGLSSCGVWVYSLCVGSSRIRDQTCVSCIGRQIPIHCTTREVHPLSFAQLFHHIIWVFIFLVLSLTLPEVWCFPHNIKYY